jgi:hypothetical protein
MAAMRSRIQPQFRIKVATHLAVVGSRGGHLDKPSFHQLIMVALGQRREIGG